MARQRDPRKERFWRRMFKLFDRSGLSVRAFCAQHQLAEPSFYSWRRILQERIVDQPGPANDPPSPSPFPLPLFLPVQLATPAPPLELLLPSGLVVRIPAGFDPATLQQLLDSLR